MCVQSLFASTLCITVLPTQSLIQLAPAAIDHLSAVVEKWSFGNELFDQVKSSKEYQPNNLGIETLNLLMDEIGRQRAHNSRR